MGGMENQSAHFDVAIVGSGLVGTCLALQLAPMPLSIALIDRQPAGADSTVLQEVITRPTLSCQDFSPRVSALSLATRQLMQQLGVWDELPAARVCDYSGMEVWDADGTGSIRFNAEELAQDALGSIVENHHLLAALGSRLAGESALTHFPGREIEALHQAADSGQAAQIQFTGGETLSARLVVGADGAQSPVRALAGFETREWDYHHSALVATVRTSLPHKKTAMQRFMTSGPLAFLPLQNDSPGLEEQFTGFHSYLGALLQYACMSDNLNSFTLSQTGESSLSREVSVQEHIQGVNLFSPLQVFRREHVYRAAVLIPRADFHA